MADCKAEIESIKHFIEIKQFIGYKFFLSYAITLADTEHVVLFKLIAAKVLYNIGKIFIFIFW